MPITRDRLGRFAKGGQERRSVASQLREARSDVKDAKQYAKANSGKGSHPEMKKAVKEVVKKYTSRLLQLKGMAKQMKPRGVQAYLSSGISN